MIYFKDIHTLEDLKQAYRKNAFDLHPDRGGDKDAFQEMLNQYEGLFVLLKDTHKNKDGGHYTRATGEDSGQFVDIINAIIKYDVNIDIVGGWVWVYGDNSYSIKEELKSMGFKWAAVKKKWYYNGNGYKKPNRKSVSYESIKEFYGCENVKGNNELHKYIA